MRQRQFRHGGGARRAPGAPALLLLWGVGCAGPAKAPDTAAPETGELMAVERWTATPEADDPWPGAEGCSADAVRIEEEVLELDTGICGHITVQQSVLSDVAEGEPLALLAWHTALTAEAPAEGWMALTLDGALLWELRRPIPSGPYVEAREDLRGVAAPAGAILRLHVENHGANSWRFAWLRRVEAAGG